jgi:DNA-binding transcriptional LysR family regulator
MLDPRRLLTFGEVARRRSFSRAAEALALTQPAVSQQVAALERQLGVRLLDRGPGGPRPTEAGELLLAHADAVAGRLAQADAQIAELVAAERDTLRLGAFPSAMATIVPAAVARLSRERPGIQVDVAEVSAADAGTAVADGRLHVAVCFQDMAVPRRETDGTERRDVGEEAMLAALPLGHPLAGHRRIPLAALAGDTWMAPSRDHLIHRACVEAGFEPRIAYVTRDPLAIGELVGAGLAVTLVPELLAGRLSGVAVVALEDEVPRRSLYVLTPAAGVRPAARDFLAAVASGIEVPPRTSKRS